VAGEAVDGGSVRDLEPRETGAFLWGGPWPQETGTSAQLNARNAGKVADCTYQKTIIPL